MVSIAPGAVEAIGLHHIPRQVDFHLIEANLRQSFRVLAAGRPQADVLELPGVTIASLGVEFQMFNSAFLNSPVATLAELKQRLELAHDHFAKRRIAWAFWFCEGWLGKQVRRRVTQACGAYGLRLSSELPGMTAVHIAKQKRALPHLEFRRAEGASTMSDFRLVGRECFHVPHQWFAEVFNDEVVVASPEFSCWVGYFNGLPVATAATLLWEGAIGLYNIATVPGYRGRGIAEAITRHVIQDARAHAGPLPLILQSTAAGRQMYEKLGFQEATRIWVFNS